MLPAQQTYFSNNYELYGSASYTGAVIQTADSGFVFLSSNFTLPYLGYTFIKTDKYGDTVFTKRYTYPYHSFSIGDGTKSLIVANDGNYLACGTAVDSANNSDAYIVKFSPLGDTLWTKRFGGTGDDYMNSMHQDESNNFWVCGSTSSQGNGQGDFWLVKLDNNCVMQWDSTYGTAQTEGAVCGEFTFDGGFLISGACANSPYVVKVDSVGAPQWQFVYSTYNGYGYVGQLPDSGYILACAKVFSVNEAQGSLVKLNGSGTQVWVQYVGFVNNNDVLTAKPIITNNAIICGGMSELTSGYYGGYLAKTDLNGYMIWQRQYSINSNAPQAIYDAAACNDGGFVLAGSCHVATQDAWLIKVDSMGCEVAGCDAVGLIEPENENAISVYPNPASDAVTITSSLERNEETYIEVLNSFGQIVDRISFNGSPTIQLITENYAVGLFYLRLMSDGTCISTEKLLIVK